MTKTTKYKDSIIYKDSIPYKFLLVLFVVLTTSFINIDASNNVTGTSYKIGTKIIPCINHTESINLSPQPLVEALNRTWVPDWLAYVSLLCLFLILYFIYVQLRKKKREQQQEVK